MKLTFKQYTYLANLSESELNALSTEQLEEAFGGFAGRVKDAFRKMQDAKDDKAAKSRIDTIAAKRNADKERRELDKNKADEERQKRDDAIKLRRAQLSNPTAVKTTGMERASHRLAGEREFSRGE